jgi:hypothetical protein
VGLADLVIPIKILHKLRKPRTITAEWNREVYFHIGFSRDEIKQLLLQAGFETQYLATKPLDFKRTEIKISKPMVKKIFNFHQAVPNSHLDGDEP